jgi:hypothetical protein
MVLDSSSVSTGSAHSGVLGSATPAVSNRRNRSASAATVEASNTSVL